MINDLTARLLRVYDSKDKELQLKAKFLLLIIMCTMTIVAITISYTAYIERLSFLILYPQCVGFVVMLIALFLLIRGYYDIATHTIFITCFTVTWVVSFSETSESLIIKMDTIAFIIAIFAATPLMLFKSRKPMLSYFIVNFLIFVGFVYHVKVTTTITRTELLDYFFDNTIIMFFLFLFAYNFVSIFSISDVIYTFIQRLVLIGYGEDYRLIVVEQCI